MKKIAVEDGLAAVRDLLLENGYQVTGPAGAGTADAIVVTGLDNNMMNRQDIASRAVVIEASGKTPREVLSRIQEIS
ncbi:YkuS family protein [Desulfotomaculum copahuensis]|nr:YkuS family protein [Desulfotomaculum copahuensis]